MKKLYIVSFHLVVIFFAGSFKSTFAQSVNHWEMIVSASDTWHYFPGNSEPPANWTNTDFNESSWLSGPGGIGFADGDDGTIINPVISVYLRSAFNIIDIANISWAILDVDYDDGFVAYLNGHEIARSNIGTVGVRPLYSTPAITNHEALMYQGGIPERYMIKNDTLKKYLTAGANELAIQVHNITATSSDLSSNTFFSVGIKDASTTYRQVPSWFEDPSGVKTNLPLLIIDTRGQVILNEPKITAYLKVVDNGPGQLNGLLDDATDYEGNIGIELRGQSSQMFPKLGYGVELRTPAGADTSVSLLGMPAEADWVFSAPYSDKSMMRNAISYELGRKMGGWQPGFKYCEAYLNGSYIGVYMLIEKIKRGADRVDINKLKPDEVSGDNLTGGYIVKVDKIQDIGTDEYFYSYPSIPYNNAINYAFTYVYPRFDEIVPEQKSYIQNYILTLQNTLNGNSFKDPVTGFRKYMDINSFVDFQIINELANNVDGYRFSTFFYKQRDSDGGKLFAGPLWDFDLSYGNVDYDNKCLATDNWLYKRYGASGNWSMHWWSRLMEDPDYNHAFAARWKALRAGPFSTDSIMADLDAHVQNMGDAIKRNFAKWPILGQYVWPNYFVGSIYYEEVEYLKVWLTNRLNWMDGNVSLSSGDLFAGYKSYQVLVFPNPVKDQLNITLTTKDIDRINFEIVDLLGKNIFVSDYSPVSEGDQVIRFAIPEVAPGYYILKITQKQQVIGIQKLIVKN
jgi:hypothetical protein